MTTTSNSLESGVTRIVYLDNLRALAMLLGVYLHAGLAYAEPARSVWLATDTKSSVIVDASIWFIHLFRMGLFFFLSGYFAKLVVERKGIRQFLWSRSIRIVLPFILFYPFLLAAMTGAIVFSLSYLESPTGLMGMIAAEVQNASPTTQARTPGTMHLWFLYYLFFFTIATAILMLTKGVFDRFKSSSCSRLFQYYWCIILLPLAMIPSVWIAGVPLPAPETFVPEWWPFVFYGSYYWAGWKFYGREDCLGALRPYTAQMGLLCVILFVAYYWMMPTLELALIVEKKYAGNKWSYAAASILTVYLSILLTIVALQFGKTYLSKRSALLSFMADASYWVYLVHLPIVVFLQTVLVPLGWPVGLKLAAVIVGTMVPCIATYCVFVRYTPIGWMLHGKRSFP